MIPTRHSNESWNLILSFILVQLMFAFVGMTYNLKDYSQLLLLDNKKIITYADYQIIY